VGYEAMVDHLRAYRNPLLCHITFREESDIIPVYCYAFRPRTTPRLSSSRRSARAASFRISSVICSDLLSCEA